VGVLQGRPVRLLVAPEAADMSFDIGDYNDVPSRIAEFRTKYPDGSLQPADPGQPYKVEEIGGKTFIVYSAAAYRTPDDQRPGIGMAWEQFPGRTPYTRDSELQNAETSAWGRAIVAALAADTRKGIASAEDVRNRQADREVWETAEPARPRPVPVAPKNPGNDPARRRMYALLGQAELTDREAKLAYVIDVIGHPVASSNDLTDAEVKTVCDRLEKYIAQTDPAEVVPA
jgi:hypothetical protein